MKDAIIRRSERLILAFLCLALDFNFLGFYMNHNKEAKSLTFRRVQKSAKLLCKVKCLFAVGMRC